MRAYKFIDARFGLKSLYERRLKQSRLHELNDPFELTPYDLTDATLRRAFLRTRDDLGKDKGILCFSEYWHNPVIWAHYSDKHRGLCLGFEIPAIQEGTEEECRRIHYITERLQFPPNFLDRPDTDRLPIMLEVLFTKFKHWEYEKEIRFWAPLQHEEDGLHFLEFDDKMRLAEVIVGQECTLPRAAIARALGSLTGEVKITKACASYDKFEMVEDDEQGR